MQVTGVYMKQEDDSDNIAQKKRYVKPELFRVELRPEEAVLGNCKTMGGTMGGGASGSCDTFSCQSQGS
jgi:hypothetical protein